MLRLDVLLAMMEKVKLKKENQLTLMSGVKVFVDDRQTQKKGYRVLSRIIEKFELESIDELIQIKEEITPMMKGQPTKQRLHLIKSFILAMANLKGKGDQSVLLTKMV